MIRDVPRDHPLLVQFREDPYPLYRYLLAAAPVQRNDLLEAWTVARYSDVVTVLTNRAIPAAARARSQSSCTIVAEFAPSSSTTGRKPLRLLIFSPTRGLPVKE